MSVIILEPGGAPGALVAAISKASAQGELLLLAPGVHWTSPGVRRRIAIGPNGLRLGVVAPGGAAFASRIKRPDRSIDRDRPDDNYGLYFVPAAPTADEIASARWREHADREGPFEFAVLMRGAIELSGVEVDCNMGEQGLEVLPKESMEHSAMLGFSGQRYGVPPAPNGVRRFIYVGFAQVSLCGLSFYNGGYADDVWFSRGYFHPNIASVVLQDITSHPRVSPRRATLGFSGLSRRIQIERVNVYSLHLEETSGSWRDEPRQEEAFEPSEWTLSNVTAERISLAAKGHVFHVRGRDIDATHDFQIYQADGVISNSRLRIGDERRLFRLQSLLFDTVTWYLPVQADGQVRGLRPTAQYGDPCWVEFRNNQFVVDGPYSVGQLLDGEYSGVEPENRVRVVCRGCHYPESFATSAFPETCIARARERGQWTFDAADFGDRDPAQTVIKGRADDIVVEIV